MTGHTAYSQKEFSELGQQVLAIGEDGIANRLKMLIQFSKNKVLVRVSTANCAIGPSNYSQRR
jgi:hypothetical protein